MCRGEQALLHIPGEKSSCSCSHSLLFICFAFHSLCLARLFSWQESSSSESSVPQWRVQKSFYSWFKKKKKKRVQLYLLSVRFLRVSLHLLCSCLHAVHWSQMDHSWGSTVRSEYSHASSPSTSGPCHSTAEPAGTTPESGCCLRTYLHARTPCRQTQGCTTPQLPLPLWENMTQMVQRHGHLLAVPRGARLHRGSWQSE